MRIKTSLFFLTFCCIITPISGIGDHYCIMENKKEIGKKKDKFKTIYPNKSSSTAGCTENGLPIPSLTMDTPISGVSAASCSWWWLITSKRIKWVYPFSVMGWVSHSPCILQLMMTYYVKTPEMGVSILSDGVGKPFSMRPAADDDLLCRNTWNGYNHSKWWGG